MGLKKITKKLQAAVETKPSNKKRADKIGKIVNKLEKKQRDLKGKLDTCEAEIARGKKALQPAPKKPVVVKKPEGKSEDTPPKATSAVRAAPH